LRQGTGTIRITAFYLDFAAIRSALGSGRATVAA
jgi:hypothetical protein